MFFFYGNTVISSAEKRHHDQTHENGHEEISDSDYQYEGTAQFIRRCGLERFSNEYHNSLIENMTLKTDKIM